MISTIVNSKDDVLSMVDYVLSKEGETNIEIRGFNASTGSFTTATDPQGLALLQQKLALTASSYGGSQAATEIGFPTFESSLISLAEDENWNLEKFVGGQRVILVGQLTPVLVLDFNSTGNVLKVIDATDYGTDSSEFIEFRITDILGKSIVYSPDTGESYATVSGIDGIFSGAKEEYVIEMFVRDDKGNYGYVFNNAPSFTSTAVPTLSGVTSGAISIGDPVNATMNEDGELFLIPQGTTLNETAIRAAAVATVNASAGVEATLDTTGIGAATYVVVGIDLADDISAASATITAS